MKLDDFGGVFRKRKGPFGDTQIDLGLAQDQTYKVRKTKGRQISSTKGLIRDNQIEVSKQKGQRTAALSKKKKENKLSMQFDDQYFNDQKHKKRLNRGSKFHVD